MRRTDIGVQFASYLVVGGIAFLTELAAFLALLAMGLTTIPASIASFVIATVANFVLSRRIAFERRAISEPNEILRFVLVAGVGLALNTAFVWGLLQLGAPPTVAKVAAVAPVLAWNFLGRRLFVFSAVVPAGTWRIAGRVLPLAGRRPAPGSAKAAAD